MHADLGVWPKLSRVHEDVAKSLADPVIGRADQIGIGQIVMPPDLVADEPPGWRITLLLEASFAHTVCGESGPYLFYADLWHV